MTNFRKHVLWFLSVLFGIYILGWAYAIEPFSWLTLPKKILIDAFPYFPSLSRSFDYATSVLAAGFLWWLAFHCGENVLRRFKFASACERVVFSSALGYGIVAYLVLFLGMLHLYYKPLMITLLLGGFLISLRQFSSTKQIFIEFKNEIVGLIERPNASWIIWLLLLFGLFTAFFMSFLPEVFYDALVYHLGVPHYFLMEHGLVPLEHSHSKFPLTIQMIYLLGLLLKDETVTKLTHWIFLLILTGGFVALGKRSKHKISGVVAAVLFVSIPTVQLNVWTSGIDVGVAMFGFLAVSALLSVFDDEENSSAWLTLMAVLAGLTVSSKYTAGFVPVALSLALLIQRLRTKMNMKSVLAEQTRFWTIVLLVFSPWLIKNLIETGNPVYPFLNGSWGHFPLAVWRFEIIQKGNLGFTPHSFTDLLRLPLVLSLFDRTNMGFQGPMFLILFPFLLLHFTRNRDISFRALCLYSALALLMGLTMTRYTRFILPAMAGAGFLLGVSVAEGITISPLWQRWSLLGLFVACYYQQMTWVYKKMEASFLPGSYLLGKINKKDYLANNPSLMYPYPASSLFETLPEKWMDHDRVLLVGDEKAFGIPVPFVYSGAFDQGPLLRIFEETSSPEEALAEFKKLNITHWLVNSQEARRLSAYGIFSFSPNAFGRFCDFWEKALVLEHYTVVTKDKDAANVLLLFRLKEIPSKDPVPFENIIGQIYDASELPRFGVVSKQDKHRFYQALAWQWPDNSFLSVMAKRNL